MAANFFFVSELLQWNKLYNDREMPWKGEKDPYKIWLSEIILQQTRVNQGLAYYQRFILAFPDIEALANAPETLVFKLWEGLGYYTRCKNLISTARFISNELNGVFPSNYKDIIALKGIGPYTAAAIASFAFNLPYAVVDGNVFRVLARYFGLDKPTDTTTGKNLFNKIAVELLDKKKPGIYNQAIMDFGATVCKPQLPLCTLCPLQKNCIAFLTGLVEKLPVKEKRIARKSRWFYYFIIMYQKDIYIRKRCAADIWENLYEFVLIEKEGEYDLQKDNNLQNLLEAIHSGFTGKVLHTSPTYRQLLTHQTIYGCFVHVSVSLPVRLNGYKRVAANQLNELPFPKFISNYLKDKNVSLNLFQH